LPSGSNGRATEFAAAVADVGAAVAAVELTVFAWLLGLLLEVLPDVLRTGAAANVCATTIR